MVHPSQRAAAANSPAQPTAADDYEEAHVHGVYEAIAPHFSATRHRPWPFVAAFLAAQPAGAVGLDVGCGNGKYLGDGRGGSGAGGSSSSSSFVVGCDRSAALAGLAGGRGAAGRVLVADGLALPFAGGRADFALCIAVVHHLSTRARRRDALRELLRCVRPRGEGRVLVYVWALEQAGSRRGWDEGGEQDLLVPWVIKGRQQQQRKKEAGGGVAQAAPPDEPDRVFQRYYHLYRKGELEEDVLAAGGEVIDGGYERDNWWVIAASGKQGEEPPDGQG